MNPNQTPRPNTNPEHEFTPAITPEELKGVPSSPEILEVRPEPEAPLPSNPYVPPAPSEYRPPETLATATPGHEVREDPNSSIAEETVDKMRTQGSRLLMLAVGFLFICVAAILALVVLMSNGDDSEPQTITVDQQLRSDLNTFALGVNNFRNGNDFFTITPEDVAIFKTSYIPVNFTDPRNNQAYTVTSGIPAVGEIQYVPGGVCNNDDSISQSGDDENYAARILLENGTLFCVEPREVQIPN